METESPVDFAGMLPAADQSVHCNVWSRELNIDPAGTAIAAEQVILVDTPQPWPKPVINHELLAPLLRLGDETVLRTKLLAAVPGRDQTDGIGVTVFRRDGGGATRRHYIVADDVALLSLATQLAAGELPSGGSQISNTAALLVCTQGSHDICCGADGTRFALEIEKAMPNVSVYRVSHTGGHRFAPTAMSFPDGRMWAHMNLDMAQKIFDESSSPAELAAVSRGWWGADRGFAQVAEQAVFASQNRAWAGADRQVVVEPLGDDAARCEVRSGSDSWQMTVRVGRIVPTIACRAPGGLPAKPGREYTIHDFAMVESN